MCIPNKLKNSKPKSRNSAPLKITRPLRDKDRVRPNPIPPVTDNRFQRQINSAFSLEQQKMAQAYLNPGHGSNYENATPLPDSTPGKRYVFKQQWVRDFNIASFSPGSPPGILFATTPFIEYPFVGGEIGGNILKGFAVPRMKGTSLTPLNFLKSQSVYGYRTIGKSLTLIDQTPLTSRSGNVIAIHKPADVDLQNPSFTSTGNRDAGINQWCMQEFPNTTTQAGSYGNIYTAPTEEGAYLQAHHVDNKWRFRTNPITKMGNNLIQPQLTTDIQNAMTAYDHGGAFIAFRDFDNPTMSCIVSPPDNCDIAIAVFDGINANTVIQVKFTIVYEFILKLSSPWFPDALSAPAYDPTFIKLLKAYEVQRSTLAGSGTLRAYDNDWNSIWTGFKQFASRVGGFAKTVAANLGMTDLPSTVSTLAKVLPFAVAML